LLLGENAIVTNMASQFLVARLEIDALIPMADLNVLPKNALFAAPAQRMDKKQTKTQTQPCPRTDLWTGPEN
jgi:hypothetical protein